jgi:hypothetical protein
MPRRRGRQQRPQTGIRRPFASRAKTGFPIPASAEDARRRPSAGSAASLGACETRVVRRVDGCIISITTTRAGGAVPDAPSLARNAPLSRILLRRCLPRSRFLDEEAICAASMARGHGPQLRALGPPLRRGADDDAHLTFACEDAVGAWPRAVGCGGAIGGKSAAAGVVDLGETGRERSHPGYRRTTTDFRRWQLLAHLSLGGAAVAHDATKPKSEQNED